MAIPERRVLDAFLRSSEHLEELIVEVGQLQAVSIQTVKDADRVSLSLSGVLTQLQAIDVILDEFQPFLDEMWVHRLLGPCPPESLHRRAWKEAFHFAIDAGTALRSHRGHCSRIQAIRDALKEQFEIDGPEHPFAERYVQLQDGVRAEREWVEHEYRDELPPRNPLRRDDPPELEVTYDDLAVLTSNRVRPQTIKNHMTKCARRGKPQKLTVKRSKKALFRYADFLKWWPGQSFEAPLPSLDEARSRLAQLSDLDG